MNERIGRRIYDEPMLKGAQGQPSYSGIELHHFQGGKELSLDRLGASGIDRRIRQHLELRAEAAGARRGKPSRFDGWFHVAAKELEQARTPPKLPLIASPIREPEPDDNIYHAHVVQPDNVLPNLVSLHIRHIFTKYGEVVQNEQKQRAPTGWREWMMACLSSITRSLWPK